MGNKAKGTESPRLVVIEGPEKGRVVPLKPGTLVIGRSKGDVIVQDPRISRSHVAVHVDERSGKVTFTDLKSLNGVQHNGDNKDSGLLRDGDRLQLGNTVFDCQTRLVEESSTEPGIHIDKLKTKRLPDPERGENTHVSEVKFLDELRPEPTSLGEAAATEMTDSGRGGLAGWLQGIPRRTKLYGGAALLLLVALIFTGSPAKKGGGGPLPVDREFSSIRQLESEGKFTEAAAKAERIKTSMPTNPEVHRLLGDLYAKQQHWEQSIDSYKRSFDLDSTQIEILPRLARLYLTTNNIQAAQSVNAEIDHFLMRGPQSRDFFISIANLYLDFPKLELRPEKMVIIGQALQNKFAPDDSSGYKLEGLGHIEQGKPEEGLKVLERGKEKFPGEESFYPYLVLGRVRLKDFETANKLVEQWIGLFPKSLQPLVLMGQLKTQGRDGDGAMKYLQKAIQLGAEKKDDPYFPKALYLMGEIYYQQNQMVEAENSLREACERGSYEGCEHVLIKGGASNSNFPPDKAPEVRTPQSLKKKR